MSFFPPKIPALVAITLLSSLPVFAFAQQSEQKRSPIRIVDDTCDSNSQYISWYQGIGRNNPVKDIKSAFPKSYDSLLDAVNSIPVRPASIDGVIRKIPGSPSFKNRIADMDHFIWNLQYPAGSISVDIKFYKGCVYGVLLVPENDGVFSFFHRDVQLSSVPSSATGSSLKSPVFAPLKSALSAFDWGAEFAKQSRRPDYSKFEGTKVFLEHLNRIEKKCTSEHGMLTGKFYLKIDAKGKVIDYKHEPENDAGTKCAAEEYSRVKWPTPPFLPFIDIVDFMPDDRF
jgi:hypothetical protein